ncbi:MAG TPA: hypothetical protein VII52_07545 [Gemmatimonadaceae bacterium]
MALNSEPLRPQLEQAQRTLATALDEACDANVDAADTGELIRIEEVLAIANEAAKEAISVRRRMGHDEPRDGANGATAEPASPGDTGTRAPTPEGAREIEDARGVRWTAFAVYPSRRTSGRAPLPDAFQRGWLAFDSGMETRRLTPIPDGWRDLSVDELRELCEKAEIAPRRSTSRQSPPPPPPS